MSDCHGRPSLRAAGSRQCRGRWWAAYRYASARGFSSTATTRRVDVGHAGVEGCEARWRMCRLCSDNLPCDEVRAVVAGSCVECVAVSVCVRGCTVTLLLACGCVQRACVAGRCNKVRTWTVPTRHRHGGWHRLLLLRASSGARPSFPAVTFRHHVCRGQLLRGWNHRWRCWRGAWPQCAA